MTRLAQGYASPLADGMAQFVAHKRVLGRRYETEVYALRLFDRHLVAQGITKVDAITPVVIEAFLAARPRVRPRSYNHLLGVLRQLSTGILSEGISSEPDQDSCGTGRVKTRSPGNSSLGNMKRDAGSQRLAGAANFPCFEHRR